MARLNGSDRTPHVLTVLAVFIVRLNGHPKTRHLAPPVEAARATLAADHAAWEAAEIAAMAAWQEVDFQDEEVDAAWMKLSRQVHARVDGDRKHPLWVGLYLEAPSETVEGTGDEHQTQNVDRVIETVRDNDDYADFRPYAEGLATTQAALVEAQVKHKAAAAKAAAAWHKRELSLGEARRVHNRVKPDLDKIFEDQPRRVKSIWG